jgi:hypothetical protein
VGMGVSFHSWKTNPSNISEQFVEQYVKEALRSWHSRYSICVFVPRKLSSYITNFQYTWRTVKRSFDLPRKDCNRNMIENIWGNIDEERSHPTILDHANKSWEDLRGKLIIQNCISKNEVWNENIVVKYIFQNSLLII